MRYMLNFFAFCTVSFFISKPAFSMQVFVKIQNGTTYTLDVEPMDTVDNVQAMLQDKNATYTMSGTVLKYAGKVLVQDRTLNDYSIGKESTIHAFLYDKAYLTTTVSTYINTLHRFQTEARRIAGTALQLKQWDKYNRFYSLKARTQSLAGFVRTEAELPLLWQWPLALVKKKYGNTITSINNLESSTAEFTIGTSSSEFVAIRQELIEKRAELEMILAKVVTDSPKSTYYLCTAFDKGSEEHIHGHLGVDSTRSAAELKALDLCTAHHGQCKTISCRVIQ